MDYGRWVTMLVLVGGCSRANPLFGDDPGATDTEAAPEATTATTAEPDPDTSAGTTEGPPPPEEGTSTTLPPEETTGPGPGEDSSTGPVVDTEDPLPATVYLWQGPISHGGLLELALPDAPDPALPSCLAANTLDELCPSADRIASLLRVEASLLTELADRGVPLDAPVVSPAGEPIATSVEQMITVGLLQPLQSTPSVFVTQPQPFWTGGTEPDDPNCSGFVESGPFADVGTLGVTGTPFTSDYSWIWADPVDCNSMLPILCMCW